MFPKWVIATFWILLTGAASVSGQEARWLSHYTGEDGGFATTVRLINTDFANDQEVSLIPMAGDGTRLDQAAVTLTLPAGTTLSLDREDLAWAGQPVSHLRVDANQAVRVSAIFRNQAPGSMPAEVPAQMEPTISARFSPVTGNATSTWFDGIVITNPQDETAAVDLAIQDASGNTLETKRVEITPGGKYLTVANGTFSEALPEQGYLSMAAGVPVFFSALRGSFNGVEPGVLTEVALDRYEVPPAPLTFANQISRIMDRRCNFCHLDGGIGPFTMTTYEGVSAVKDFIEFNVANDIMPPWRASDACEELVDSQALDPAEKEMILAWVRSGAPEGDPARTQSPPPPLESSWELGQPDLVLQYPEAFDFPVGPDEYRCFPIPLNNTEPLYLKRFQVLPGNNEIVHHVLLYLEDNNAGQILDNNDPGPGYTCFGGSGTGTVRLIAGWAPGMPAQVLKGESGITIPPGSHLIMQVHYHSSGTAGSDQSQVGLYFSEEQPEKELYLLPLVNTDFRIPAGAKNHIVTQEVELPFFVEAELYSIAPHMHLLGQAISVQLTHQDGREQCLIDIPKWDFNWQRFYEYPEPIKIPGGSTISLRCVFDNSVDNPFNPSSPPIDVGWGEATTDEMALAFLAVTANIPLDFKQGGWEWPLAIAGYDIAPDGSNIPVFNKGRAAKKSCCSPDKQRPWCPTNIESFAEGAAITPTQSPLLVPASVKPSMGPVREPESSSTGSLDPPGNR